MGAEFSIEQETQNQTGPTFLASECDCQWTATLSWDGMNAISGFEFRQLNLVIATCRTEHVPCTFAGSLRPNMRERSIVSYSKAGFHFFNPDEVVSMKVGWDFDAKISLLHLFTGIFYFTCFQFFFLLLILVSRPERWLLPSCKACWAYCHLSCPGMVFVHGPC